MAVSALDRHGAFLPLIGGLIAFAWLTLLLWEHSPYGRYLDHGQWTDIGLAANLCRALPAGPIVLPALLYIGGWVLMTAAMMLPATLPLLVMFARLTERRSDRAMLLTLVILGYLLIWGAFGLAAHLIDVLLHTLVVASAWLTLPIQHAQVSLPRQVRGQSARQQAFLVGVHHGLFCVGCCWAIMLLMFVVGTGSVGWMFALAVVMAIEKNVSWGRKLSAPLGVSLLLWCGAVVAEHVWQWPI